MSERVTIAKEKMDELANAVASKSGVPVGMTVDQMIEAVKGIASITISETSDVHGGTIIEISSL